MAADFRFARLEIAARKLVGPLRTVRAFL